MTASPNRDLKSTINTSLQTKIKYENGHAPADPRRDPGADLAGAGQTPNQNPRHRWHYRRRAGEQLRGCLLMLALMNTNDPVKLQQVFMQNESVERCLTWKLQRNPGIHKRLMVNQGQQYR